MLTRHYSATIVLLVAAALLGGGLISLPAMQKVEAAIGVDKQVLDNEVSDSYDSNNR